MESDQTTDIEGADSWSGDARPEWFERLWADSHARIYNLAARIVGDRDDAADITQEVFLRAFTHPPSQKGMRDPQPWLYRVTVNACYDHLRRRAVRPTAPLEAAGELASARDGFAAAELTRAVETALGRLTPRYRTALVLKDLHGFDTDEIAGAMDVTRATARVLLHRSRAAFKKAFREGAPAGGALPVAGLAAYLPTLSVPQALQMPPSLAGLAPMAAAPVAAPAAAVPAAGVLAKISGALGVKVAATVATVALATGGAAAVHELTPVVHDVGGSRSETSAIQAPARGGSPDQGHGLSQGAPLMGSPRGLHGQSARRQSGVVAGRSGSGPGAGADAAGPGLKPSGQSDAQGGANADSSRSGGAGSDTGSGNAGGAATGGGSGSSSALGSSSGGAGSGSTGAGGSGGPGGSGSDAGEPSEISR